MISLMRRTEEEITGSDENIAGNVFIGAGETETVRLFAQVAKKTAAEISGYPVSHLQRQCGACIGISG